MMDDVIRFVSEKSEEKLRLASSERNGDPMDQIMVRKEKRNKTRNTVSKKIKSNKK